MNYAGFWKRALANFIDYTLLIPATVWLNYQSFLLVFERGLEFSFNIYYYLNIGLLWLYFAIFHTGKWQATPGKRLIGIYLTGSDGGKPTAAAVNLRFFYQIFPLFLTILILEYVSALQDRADSDLLIILIGIAFGLFLLHFVQYILAGVTAQKQTLYDLFAKTLVLNGRPDSVSESSFEGMGRVGVSSSETSGGAKQLVLAGFDSDGNVVRLAADLARIQCANTIIRLGRDSVMCDFAINDATVSRAHALLRIDYDNILVEDLGSSNGTRVNAALLKPNNPITLRSGDTLEFGTVKLSVSF